MIGIIGAMKVELEALKARLQDVTVTRISLIFTAENCTVQMLSPQ
jgi:hypothetical protein